MVLALIRMLSSPRLYWVHNSAGKPNEGPPYALVRIQFFVSFARLFQGIIKYHYRTDLILICKRFYHNTVNHKCVLHSVTVTMVLTKHLKYIHALPISGPTVRSQLCRGLGPVALLLNQVPAGAGTLHIPVLGGNSIKEISAQVSAFFRFIFCICTPRIHSVCAIRDRL